MQIQQLTAPTAWRALLWKDFQQVKPALTLLTGSLVAVQALALVCQLLFSSDRQGRALEWTVALGFMAPLFGILACVGLLVGQERQSGSWAWSSSLPMSWRTSMLSKICVALLASGLMLVPLAVMPLVAVGLGCRVPPDFWLADIFAAPITILMLLNVGAALTCSVLIFRESLTGLIVGSVWGFFVQTLLLSAGTYYIATSWLGLQDTSNGRMDWNESIISLSQLAVLFLVTCGLMSWLYRWRWGVGQSTALSLFRPNPSVTLTRWRPVRRAPTPSEFAALFLQSWRSSLGLRLAIVVAFVVFNLLQRPVPLLQSLLFGLLGITTFEADQTLGRFRFYADRGARPWKFVTARLLTTSLLAAFFGLLVGLKHYFVTSIATYMHFSSAIQLAPLGIELLACVAAFAVGVLASLCFDRTLFSFLVTLLCIFGFIAPVGLLLVSAFGCLDIYPGWFGNAVLAWSPLSTVLLVLATYWLAPKWMISSKPRLQPRFAWIYVCLLALPFLIPTLFGFLWLPNVPWRGLTVTELEQRAAVDFVGPTLQISYVQRTPEAANVLDGGTASPRQIKVGLEKLLADLKSPAQAISADRQQAYARNVSNLITETARWARTVAPTGPHNTQTAAECWALALECNQRLQALDLHNYFPLSLPARRETAILCGDLKNASNTPAALKDELRVRAAEDTARDKSLMQDWLRSQSALAVAELRSPANWNEIAHSTWSGPTRMVPTLRWRAERALALELERALSDLEAGLPIRMYTPTFLSINPGWNELEQFRNGNWIPNPALGDLQTYPH